MVAFSDIGIALHHEYATHFPIDGREFFLGILIDSLLYRKDTKETILKKMKYMPCYYNNKWFPARSDDKGPIMAVYPMRINEPFNLINQQGTFVLKFAGQDVVWGRRIEVNTFEELLELGGLREAFIVPHTITTTSSIPKRLDSNLFRF